MENKQPDTYRYTYSVRQQEELRRIRNKYAPPQEDAMTRLRRLDASTTRPGTVLSLILGVLSTLVLGFGMCCCLLWAEHYLIHGIIIGTVGIGGILLAYPVYTAVTRARRRKVAPEILRLTDELMGTSDSAPSADRR